MGKYDDYAWTATEVSELADMAKRKGISKAVLAETYLGIHPATLSYWMSEKPDTYRPPNETAKRLLTCIAPKIERMADRNVRV